MSSVFSSPLLPHPPRYGLSSRHLSSPLPCFPSVLLWSEHTLPTRFQSRVVRSGACVCLRAPRRRLAGWVVLACVGACEGCGPRKEHHHAPHLQEGGGSDAWAEAAPQEGRGPAGRQDEASGGEGGHRDALPKGAGGARGRGRGKAKASPAEASPAQRARRPTRHMWDTSRLRVSPTHYSTA